VIVARHAGVYLHEEVAGRRWRVSAGSFFQSSPDGAEALLAAVARALGDALVGGGQLVDAYCGVGLLGGSLAAAATGVRVTAVESQRTAVADAKANMADLDGRVVRAEVADRDAWRDGPVVAVVADPARSGLGRSAAAAVADCRAPVVVLVSCDPASLARDACLLASHGYRLASVEIIDLFPHTFHVEAVSRFELVGVAHPPH
jgi:23S rRNA (uracil1939-C5)-methyltransferase